MSRDLDRALDRIRQGTAARIEAARRRLNQAAPTPAAAAATPAPGARVFDPLTGEEGTVIHVGSANVVVPPPDR